MTTFNWNSMAFLSAASEEWWLGLLPDVNANNKPFLFATFWSVNYYH